MTDVYAQNTLLNLINDLTRFDNKSSKSNRLVTTILTPNRRLAATLHKLYHAHHLALGTRSWLTPDILPLTSWLERCWHDYADKAFTNKLRLLTNLQEQFLWETIVAQTKISTDLLQLSETADITKAAWQLLKQWQLDIQDPIFTSACDYIALQSWVTHFQTLCAKKNWLDMASLPEVLTEKILQHEINPPQKILLLGFTELSPQLKHLIKACEKRGSEVTEIELEQKQLECVRVSLQDQEHEILTMARWSKQILVANPQATIGCVIPSLDKNRDRVRQIFSDVFATEEVSPFPQSMPVNISAGKSLAQYPIVHTALQLLALHKNTISLEALNYLLVSPFIGDSENERIKRANFDALLRQKNISTITLSSLINSTTSNQGFTLTRYCPALANRIQQFFTAIAAQPKKATYSVWAHFFTQLLTLLGWPGERSLNSEEYQVVENWLKLFADYSNLDHVANDPVNFHQALQTLQKMTGKISFQPKTPDAPIQILGLLEAAALPFDYLWVSGLDDLSWPPQPKPNPLIPKRLQRELNMPHATAERELSFCQTLIQQFNQSAKRIVFSHAEKSAELELQASPLIRHFPTVTTQHFNLDIYTHPSERIYLTKELEILIDDVAPAYQMQEKIRGGINVIKQQALCPFKAFAEWRLHAHALEKPVPGLRAKDRGTIIHKTLEIIWQKIKNHSNLINFSTDSLNIIINECIQEALTLFPTSHSEAIQYLNLEKRRLNKLIHDWLQLEKERTPFAVVTHEKLVDVTLNQLKFSVRIDRIDELADGKKIIIDYKTGKNNEINSWFGERPEEPQLPIYTLIDTINTVGITFAQIASGEHCFKGLSQYALDIKGIKLISEIKKATALSWAEQLTQWNTILLKLSDDFYHGIAKVDPKEPPKTCTWCELKPLCRINEELSH